MSKRSDELVPPPSNTANSLAELIASTPHHSDTASALVEVYEQSERAYRAAMMAGQPPSGVSSGTDKPSAI